MKSTVITIDLKTQGDVGVGFTGSIFRGWLGFILKCNPKKVCSEECDNASSCPYFMVFKERRDVKPYALLSFKHGDFIRNFIKIYGDRKRLAPRIISDIHERAGSKNFGGLKYSIENLEARNIEISKERLSDVTTVVFVTPVHLLRHRKIEVLPSFNSLISASVRAFNRITKYYDSDSYPFRISEELADWDAPMLDFEIKTTKFLHNNMNKKSIKLEGVVGWISYDTSSAPEQAGEALRLGEALQIGKHTTYGLGGFLINMGV